MADWHQVNALMSELGPILDPLDITAYEAEGTWTLLVDEETLLVIEHDEELGRLFLSADIGAPPEAERLAVYELLLRYNAQGRETGGVRMALEEPGGMLMQICDLPLAGLDVTGLQAAIAAFARTADAWRRLIAGGAGVESVASGAGLSATGLDPRFMPGMIKG